ncbi:putative MFS-type transporter [Yarrowia sp. B02]|nr:putative MFS-type transporter [Yarrowia sp. B02]
MLDVHKTPGTIRLTSATSIIAVPTPSSDPDDPLNWSRRRKLLCMACMSLFTLASGIASANMYSILVPISQDSGLSLDTLNQGTGYMFLFLGLGCLFWQPVAQQYGKRFVYLISMLLTLVGQVWTPFAASSSAHWIGCKIFQGFVQAPIESLCEVTVSDVFFEHERGTWVGLYAFVLMFSNFIAPVVAAPIAEGMGWQWVLYWGAIFCAVALVILFFLFEETNYLRAPVEDHVIVDDRVSELQETPSEEKKASESSTPDENSVEVPAPLSTVDTVTYTPKTYRQKLAIFDERPMMLWTMAKRPIMLLRYPAIVYSGFLYGSGLIWFNVLNATASLILSSAPYEFTPIQVGLAYLSPALLAAVIGWGGGYLSDVLRVYMARRNNNISEPEHRLWVLVVYIIVCPCALILWGVGAASEIHWFGLVVGMGLIGGFGTIAATASVTYSIDSYREIASDSMATVIVIRNLMSFAIGYGITPWVTREGYSKAFGQAAGIAVACIGVFLPVIYFGKKWREGSKERYWKLVQESIDKGIAH